MLNYSDPFSVVLPDGYWPLLDVRQTLEALTLIPRQLAGKLAGQLHLQEIYPPAGVAGSTGLAEPDDPVVGGQMLPSNAAKWTRCALKRYGVRQGEGVLHMGIVNSPPWDGGAPGWQRLHWERVLPPGQRFLSRLEEEAHLLTQLFVELQKELFSRFSGLSSPMKGSLLCLTAQYLENLYPSLPPHEREKKICRQSGSVFIEQPGLTLDSGKVTRPCLPDIDDWRLNGVLLMLNPVTQLPQTVARLGIRTGTSRLQDQWTQAGRPGKPNTAYHRLLLDGRLPASMGCEVDLSAAAMVLLKKVHRGEVWPCGWDNQTILCCERRGIHLL